VYGVVATQGCYALYTVLYAVFLFSFRFSALEQPYSLTSFVFQLAF